MTQNNNPWKHAEIRYAVFPEDWMRSQDGVRPAADCETRHEAAGEAAILSRDRPRDYIEHPYPTMTVGPAP